jgi:outer membrane protein OmpA-like peptidoglycan-associated protein
MKRLAILALTALSALSAAAEGGSVGTTPGSDATAGAGEPVRFAFSYSKGDKFRILSTVDESVYVNRRLVSSTQILNRIAYEIADAATDSSWGLLRGSFETLERTKGSSAFAVTGRYDSEFKRDRLGRYTIGSEYFMPVVRGDPTFPDRELRPGDTWNAPGEERHDLRPLGIPDAYSIPIDVRYKYIGPAKRDGADVQLVSASYTIFLRPPRPRAYEDIFPVQIAGYSEQKIYWSPAAGDAIAYEEKFDFVFDWSDGSSREWRGSASSKQIAAERMDRETMRSELEKAVADLPNVSVAATDEGVTISIEDIRFEPDSATLEPEELAKVARIAELLKRYPDRDVLVAGHSAKAGYAEGRKLLSERRAKTVAERLIELGARTSDRVRAEGFGDERPIAGNDTEAGRARNRRVEITILEN